MYYKCVKFHKNPISRLGGVALTRYMDGRMDKMIPIYPPNFVCGGYNNKPFRRSCTYKDNVHGWTDGRTVGQGDSYIPPETLFAGGMMITSDPRFL